MNKVVQPYIEHFTKAGDRWDALAFTYYENVSLQNVLIGANRDLFPAFSVPAVLPAGLLLKIPLLEKKATVSDNLLPFWKRGMSI